MNKGIVYLVGAGPGDYKLMSVKGVEVLKIAEVIVYDRLADARLLEHTRPEAELVYVGKASSQHIMRQQDINALLVDRARQGKTVVRLKGGDPFVFGRGGEEALELAAARIPFEIVPGITSAISVPAYAGIPVTHRGIATSFTVVTGHEEEGKSQSTLRWDKLAMGADTLVFLMGVENLPNITAKLIAHGRAPTTPAAVIRWGTKPEQEVLVTTLGEAAQETARRGIKPPAIFIVGDVVSLRKDIAWFDNRPLSGKTILVTRAREQASTLTEALEALGAKCVEAPAIKINPPASFDRLDRAILELNAYQWLIFTSVNGVDSFFNRLQYSGRDTRALREVKVAAIGLKTAEKLRQFGILADVVPAEFRAEGIVSVMEDKLAAGMRVLIPRAAVARDMLPEALSRMGVTVDVVEAYRTGLGEADGKSVAEQLKDKEIQFVTFTSSSTVTNLIGLLGEEAASLLASTTVACIGPITAETCVQHGLHPDIIAEEFTIRGLVDAIHAYICEKEE
ncbi:MAG: uroporphyrin-III C-methyltransferase [Firmicutes bacterium]|nr:uroporphyrin-III C-methyltransferase [Bacillota bacterium]